jgi:hypothetical protein
MSKTSIKAAWIAMFIVGLVAMYGYGYRSGKHAQISLESAMQIAKAQFTCRMEKR